VRAAFSPALLASGAVGYGGTVLLQNAGITRTSVSHAALLIGTAPIMVAVIAAVWHRTVAHPVAWTGFAVSLSGVALIAAGGGGQADLAGDGMVLASVLLSAGFTVTQARLLPGRDPVAVTGVQFLGAALVALPFSVLTEGMPPAPAGLGPVAVVIALAAGGTLLPFSLFAYGQSRLPAQVAGAFLNIEPLVGAVAGVVVFGDPAGPAQLGGAAAILGGIALSSVRRPAGWRVPAALSRRWRPADRSAAVTAGSNYYPAGQEFKLLLSRPYPLARRENPLLSDLPTANPDLRSPATLHTLGRCGRNPDKEIYEGTNADIHGSRRWRADGWAGRRAGAGQHVHRAIRRHAEWNRRAVRCLAFRDRSRQPPVPQPEPHLREPEGERAGRALWRDPHRGAVGRRGGTSPGDVHPGHVGRRVPGRGAARGQRGRRDQLQQLP
jgi:drug/metabolite transporter (DMT)-like permease